MKKLIILLILMITSLLGQQTIYLGVDNRYGDYEKTRKAFQPIIHILDSLSKNTWKLKVYKDQTSLLEGLVKDEVHIIKMSPLVYSIRKLEQPIIAVALGKNKKGQPYYYSAIVAYKRSSVSSLVDLKGKRIAFGSRFSSSSFLIPLLYLEKMGISLEDLHYDFVGSQVQIVLKLMNLEYDAGAIRSDLLDKVRPGSFKILYLSDPIPESPLVIKKNQKSKLYPMLKEDLTAFNLYLETHPSILKNIESDFRYGFIFDFDDEMFTPLRLAFLKFQKQHGQK